MLGNEAGEGERGLVPEGRYCSVRSLASSLCERVVPGSLTGNATEGAGMKARRVTQEGGVTELTSAKGNLLLNSKGSAQERSYGMYLSTVHIRKNRESFYPWFLSPID